MASTIAEISAVIKTKIESIKDGGVSIFGEVKDYRDSNFQNYPAVLITAEGFTGETIDTNRIERPFRFKVELWQEQSRKGKEEAASIMRTITDRVIQAFDQDPDLGGEMEIVNPVSGEFDFSDREGTFNFATIILECRAIVNNYS